MLSIIVPTYNRDKCLNNCLLSLINQLFTIDAYEILVIDNGSTDNTLRTTEDLIQQFPHHRLRYIYEPEPGLLSGRHRGAKEAKGDILIFVDDDIIADSHWLQAISATFEDPLVQLVGGRNLPNYEVSPPPWLEWFWVDHPLGKFCIEHSLLDLGEEVVEIDANYVWGLNFSIRRQALFDLGGFHPDCIPKHLQHFQGDGETGLTLKANQLGCKSIYQPKALVHHQVSKSRMTYKYFENRYFYQGVCNSYTKIRRIGYPPKIDPFDTPQNLENKIKRLKQDIVDVMQIRKSEEALKKRFHQSHQAGIEFHQNSVRQNPQLLNWILKPDYWNYTLPRE